MRTELPRPAPRRPSALPSASPLAPPTALSHTQSTTRQRSSPTRMEVRFCYIGESSAVPIVPDRPYTDRQIPTILSYVDGEAYYGGQAKAFLIRNPQNTIAYFKEFLGKEYGPPLDLNPPRIRKLTIITASSPSTPPTTTPPPTPKSPAPPSPSPSRTSLARMLPPPRSLSPRHQPATCAASWSPPPTTSVRR